MQNLSVKIASERIQEHIHHTPVLQSSFINEHTGASLFFKCENFQKGGSYKLRGALNASLCLTEAQRSKGLGTHSSGNFAQAVAISAKLTKVKAYIVMPSNAPSVKREATIGYGATVKECKPTLEAREATLADIIQKTGASKLHPSNDIDVIVGQGTCAYEMICEHSDLDYIITPVGGGGVVAGTILACQQHSPQTKVIGAEPTQADDAYQSLKLGKIVPSINPNTIADGLRTQLGSNNFPIIKEGIDQILLVSEEAIIQAMAMVWNRMKIIIEPSSATSLAAVIANPKIFNGKKVGLVITGGNVDLSNLPF
jgi:threonine dehydratase